MEFSYSQTENFEMEKLSSDTGYFKKNSGDQQGVCQCENWPVWFQKENRLFKINLKQLRTLINIGNISLETTLLMLQGFLDPVGILDGIKDSSKAAEQIAQLSNYVFTAVKLQSGHSIQP